MEATYRGRKRRRTGADGTGVAATTRDDDDDNDGPGRRGTPEPAVTMRSYRLRMRPTAAQRRELKRWFECSRWAYDAVVRAVNAGSVSANAHAPTVVGGPKGVNLPARFRGIHRTVWWNGMRDAVAAFQANRAKQRRQAERGERVMRTFHVRERTETQPDTEVIRLDAAQPRSERHRSADYKTVLRIRAASPHRTGRRRHADVTFGTSLKDLGPVRVVDSARVVDRLTADGYLKHEGRLQWNHHRRNAFYLIVTWPVEIPPLRVVAEDRPVGVVSLDPGARHFQTWYDPRDGSHGELLAGWRTGTGGRTTTTTGTGLGELDRRLGVVDARACRRRRRPWTGTTPECLTGRKARQERRRLHDGGCTNPGADPDHRRWLFNRWRKAIRERREAHHRACERLKDWRRHAHYDAIRFLDRTVRPRWRLTGRP
jgi:hypothetical protein